MLYSFMLFPSQHRPSLTDLGNKETKMHLDGPETGLHKAYLFNSFLCIIILKYNIVCLLKLRSLALEMQE